jgi:hypothetical protein
MSRPGGSLAGFRGTPTAELGPAGLWDDQVNSTAPPPVEVRTELFVGELLDLESQAVGRAEFVVPVAAEYVKGVGA